MKKVKVYEYEFGIELADLLEGIVEKTGFTPVSAEKHGDTVKIRFEEELPQSSLTALEEHIKLKIPHIKLKNQQIKTIEINEKI